MFRDKPVFHRFAAGALLSAAAAGLSPAPVAADLNGFLRDRGRGDVALSFTAESYDEFWMGRHKVSDPGVGEVETRSASLWMAYGVSDRLTLIATLPYVDAGSDGAGGFRARDLQDLTLLGAGRLASGGNAARSALIGAVGIRTIASDYEPNRPVDIGDGTSDWLVRLVYQLDYGRFYVSQQVGFDLRGGDAPDGYPLYTEVGATWGPATASAFYSRLLAEGGTDIGDPGFTFPGNAEESERIGVKVYGRTSKTFGLSGAYFTTLSGRNTGDSSGLSIGANYSF